MEQERPIVFFASIVTLEAFHFSFDGGRFVAGPWFHHPKKSVVPNAAGGALPPERNIWSLQRIHGWNLSMYCLLCLFLSLSLSQSFDF